jgi:hypothetical protein
LNVDNFFIKLAVTPDLRAAARPGDGHCQSDDDGLVDAWKSREVGSLERYRARQHATQPFSRQH